MCNELHNTFFDLTQIIISIIGIIIGLASVIVAYLLYIEAKKMRDIATQPEIVAYLFRTGNSAVLRIQNSGNGTGYNIQIFCDKDIIVFGEENINESLKRLIYLAPKQYYDIVIGHLLQKGSITGMKEDCIITIQWTTKDLDENRHGFAQFILSKDYFKMGGNESELHKIAKSIDDLRKELKK